MEWNGMVEKKIPPATQTDRRQFLLHEKHSKHFQRPLLLFFNRIFSTILHSLYKSIHSILHSLLYLYLFAIHCFNCWLQPCVPVSQFLCQFTKEDEVTNDAHKKTAGVSLTPPPRHCRPRIHTQKKKLDDTKGGIFHPPPSTSENARVKRVFENRKVVWQFEA
jgi:hypothetical protein